MEDILSAFRVLSDRAFSCAGHVVETRGDSLQAALRDCLYRLCYTQRFQGKYDPAVSHSEPDVALQRALQSANSSRTIQEPGWKIEQVRENGKILATRGSVTRWFLPGQFLTGKGPGFPPAEDEVVSIYAPRDSTIAQESFYMAFGESICHDGENLDVLRFYWNVTPTGAPLLMSIVTRELNRFQVPFLLKCGNHPEMFQRSDVAVLYINRWYYETTARIIAGAYPQLAPVLKAGTPLFTRCLAPGLGFAEDPQEALSFGLSRCAILADTLRACYEQKLETIGERQAELEKQFRDRRIDPQRAYLNPGSHDVYEFPPQS